jgi:hypothetical protein
MEQVEDNIKHFSPVVPLSEEEQALVLRGREMFNKLPFNPCTECNYCAKCPQNIPIARLFGSMNEKVRFGGSWFLNEYRHQVKPENRIDTCTECGACEEICPMKINIVERLKELDKELVK